MSVRRILVPTDFSLLSQAAIPYATSLARAAGATLLIAYVDERLAAYRIGPGYSGITEPGMQSLVHSLVALLPTEPRVVCEHRLLMGDPAEELVRCARDEHVDLIVMSTHGHSAAVRMLLGSVAEAVSRRAPCPVLLLRTPSVSKEAHPLLGVHRV